VPEGVLGSASETLALPRYAHVDLTTGEVRQLPVSADYYRRYVGGKTLAARLLLDLLPTGTDPLAPESVIIINTGPLNGTGAPSTSRFNMSFKNVLTGGIASTNCGGNFGFTLRKAGFEGLVISGAATSPVYLEILDGEIAVKDAGELWGLSIEQTQTHFDKKLADKKLATFFIGVAGENLVRYAGVASGERIAGRCGGGAVFGSKKLKGLVCSGKGQIPIHNREGFKKFIAKWARFLRKHPMTGEAMPNYGSSGILNKANAMYALPTRNFSRGFYAEADAVSGETMAETVLDKNKGCTSCPIRCERRVRSGQRVIKGPEYETLGLFGPNIEVSDLDAIIEINQLCDDLGMDTISCAGTLAFAMELGENGGKDFGLRFGDAQSVKDALPKIANRESYFSELANGSKWLCERYGGSEYAIHAKGLELASYEPRRSVGMGLGYATSNRGGCHLGGGYTSLLESISVLSMDPQSPRGKAQWTVLTQNALDAVSTVGSCLFSALTFIPAVLYKLGPNHWVTRALNRILTVSGPVVSLLLNASPLLRFNTLLLFPHAEAARLVTGLPLYTGSFFSLGERCFNLERLFNLREGLSAADDTLPKRLTEVPQDPSDPTTVVPLTVMLATYYRVRGWDKQGVPTPRKLRSLGIEV
jgi:aldehyde:ferredoxin oxidoreductase